MRIEIWSDIACPWCFIGKRRFETALEGFAHKDEVQVQWRSYQLDPSMPERYDGTQLQYLSERKGLDPQQVSGMLAHVVGQARGEGLSYDFDNMVMANSFAAHRLIHAARDLGGAGAADAVKEALLSAQFEQGRNIGDVEVLVAIAVAAGLDAGRVRETLDSDDYADDVRQDIAEARALGVSGVPFFVIDRRYGISGAQPSEVFAGALEKAWQDANPLQMVAPGTDGPACGPDGC